MSDSYRNCDEYTLVKLCTVIEVHVDISSGINYLGVSGAVEVDTERGLAMTTQGELGFDRGIQNSGCPQ